MNTTPSSDRRNIDQLVTDLRREPLQLPPANATDVQERRLAIRNLILEATRNTLFQLCDNQGNGLVYDNAWPPLDGVSTIVDGHDVHDFMEAFRHHLDPQSPHFDNLLADPDVGITRLISIFTKMAVEVASRGGSPSAIFKYFRRLTEEDLPVDVLSVGRVPETKYYGLEELPWDKPESRSKPFTAKGLLQEKLGGALVRYWSFMNDYFLAQTLQEPRFAEQAEYINTFKKAFGDLLSKAGITSDWIMCWFFTISHALETQVTSAMTTEMSLALMQLGQETVAILGGGDQNKHALIGQAVQKFAQQTLPALVNQAPQAGPALLPIRQAEE
ncbi:MAG: hypothetical protein AAB588_00345 [Patescibacteria group bacterium]